MKLIKKLALLCASLTLCAGVCSLTACMGGEDTSSATSSVETSSETPAAAAGFKFKVLNKDGTPATNASVQLCVGANLCYAPQEVNADGEVVYVSPSGEVVHEIHVMVNGTTVEFDGATETGATYNTEAIVLTLK